MSLSSKVFMSQPGTLVVVNHVPAFRHLNVYVQILTRERSNTETLQTADPISQHDGRDISVKMK